MKKKKGKEDFILKHEYPGGSKALREFIAANLVYPESALKEGIEGSVLATYELDFDGSVRSVRILHGIGSGCDEEAERVIRLLRFAPQNNHGNKVSSTHKIRIHFKLPEIPKPVETRLQYEVKPAVKKTSSPEDKNAYTYTIRIKDQ